MAKGFYCYCKGVSQEYLDMTSFDSLLVSGQYLDKFESNQVAILGRGCISFINWKYFFS